jgi:K(+)-stimulated pyrophosphate-energized sodium pump
MIFSIILLLQQHMGEAFTLSLVEPRVLLGLIMGGATVYWFTGASMQAVTTGAFRAVEYIQRNIKIDSAEAASIEKSKEVVKICTQYAQAGMFNIFIVIFCLTLAYGSSTPFSSSRTSSRSRSAACSRPCTWPTPAARGTTPRRSWKSN